MTDLSDNVIGKSPELRAMINAAEVAAACDVNILIQGETGVGKELLAATIHRASLRSQAPFITVNCAALPESLADAELFGHRRGAFTGATSDHDGRLAAAHSGTVLLDEVGELPLSIQAKLLRFLESGECQVVGGPVQHVNVRVIAATNRDLAEAVRAGSFREDLYYRLHVVPLTIPPLRHRRGDIPLLLEHFVGTLAAKHRLTPPEIRKDALATLERYPWPGNVRELRNLCERLVVLRAGQAVSSDDLPAGIGEHGQRRRSNSTFNLPADGIDLEVLEVELIRQALDRSHGNRSLAARLLGISRDTLLYRIKKHQLLPA